MFQIAVYAELRIYIDDARMSIRYAIQYTQTHNSANIFARNRKTLFEHQIKKYLWTEIQHLKTSANIQ